MSCDRNGARVSGLGAARSGISRLGSRAANVSGGLLARLEQAQDTLLGQVVAPAVNRVAGPVVTAQQRLEPVQPGAGWTLWGVQKTLELRYGRGSLESQAATAVSQGGMGLLKLALKFTPYGRAAQATLVAADVVGSKVALSVARRSRTADDGEVVQARRRLFFFKQDEKIRFWRSGLTPLFNRSDALTRRVASSHGLMLAARGRAWHLGSSEVETGHGRQTVTHLQSLGVVGLQHYYFNRTISRAEAAGVASGEIPARRVPGYAGEVSRVESLAPAWAQAKHSWLKMRLHWPGQPGGAA